MNANKDLDDQRSSGSSRRYHDGILFFFGSKLKVQAGYLWIADDTHYLETSGFHLGLP